MARKNFPLRKNSPIQGALVDATENFAKSLARYIITQCPPLRPQQLIAEPVVIEAEGFDIEVCSRLVSVDIEHVHPAIFLDARSWGATAFDSGFMRTVLDILYAECKRSDRILAIKNVPPEREAWLQLIPGIAFRDGVGNEPHRLAYIIPESRKAKASSVMQTLVDLFDGRMRRR